MENGDPLLYLQSPPIVPILSQMNGDHAFPSCFLKIHFNIIIILVDNIKGFCRINCYFQVSHSQNWRWNNITARSHALHWLNLPLFHTSVSADGLLFFSCRYRVKAAILLVLFAG